MAGAATDRDQPLTLAAKKERTLRMAWLVSLWAPVATALALALGRSTTQLADMLRRSSELLALFLAWLVYRKVSRGATPVYRYGLGKLESLSSLLVALVMLFSFTVIVYSAVQRLLVPKPLGWVVPGMAIAGAGALVNGWFWLRHQSLARQESSPVFEAQWRLYRAKTVLDLGIVATLGAGLLFAGYAWSRLIDPLGSIAVGGFLAVSAVRIAAGAVGELLDRSLPPATEARLRQVLAAGVGSGGRVHGLRTRQSGADTFVEVYVAFDSRLTGIQVQAVTGELAAAARAELPGAQVLVVCAAEPPAYLRDTEISGGW